MHLRVSLLAALAATSLLLSSPARAAVSNMPSDPDTWETERGCGLGFAIGALGTYLVMATVIGPPTLFTTIFAFSAGGIGGCWVATESLETPRKF
jgi:hypothetical protein